MHSGNTVSYKTILDKLLRDFPFEDKFNQEECLEWLAEFMAHTNCGMVMESKVEYVQIIDARGELPFDLHRIKQCADVQGKGLTIEDLKCGKGTLLPMRWTTDNFHMRYHSDNRDYTTNSTSTYTVNTGHIFTSFECGWVAIAYEAIPTDCDGFPIIPAEQQWLEGATFHLAWKIARKMMFRNEITMDKFQWIERERDWYFAQAVNHTKQWNGVDDAESWKNAMVRTIPSIQDHSSFFANMQLPEQRYFRQKMGTSVGNGFGNVPIGNVPRNVPSFDPNHAVNYLPILTTGTAVNVTNTTADSICHITSYGSTSITDYGICYATTGSPGISDSKISFGAASGPLQFTASMVGLLPNTVYYIRSYATHATGTSYGNEVSFKTLP